MYCVSLPVYRLRLLLIVVACVMTASCAQQQIQFQANGFNRAIEATTNETLLLNIVRASKDLPVYFTKLTGYTGNNMLSGSLQPKFPFGPKAVASYDLGLGANWSSGVSSMQFVDLNQQEGLQGLHRAIEFHVFDQYANNNHPWWVLATLMIQRIDISYPINAAIIERHREVCNNNLNNKICQYTSFIKNRCKNWVTEYKTEFVGKGVLATVSHVNDGRSECGYLRFQAFIALLSTSGFNVWTLPSKEESKVEKKKTKKGSTEVEIAPSKPKFETELRFLASPKADAALKAADKALKKYRRKGIDPIMRSPKRMIEFLGELTAAQNYGEKTFIPVTLVNREPVTFFRVVRGEKAGQGVAVTVLGPEGEVFSVPQPVLGSPTKEQSLAVLSIVSDLLNQSTSKESYPTPGVVEFRSIN